MSESQTYIVTFSDVPSYEKYKREVLAENGTIKSDLGSILLGFTAVIPPTVLQLMQSGSLADNGITTLEPDSVVTTQKQVIGHHV